MPERGRICIETCHAELAAETPSLKRGRYVCVSVSDTGCGMTKEVIRRAFDPFFTTKPAGKGTGLGLPMIKAFVDKSEGHIDVQSAEGLGTTICDLSAERERMTCAGLRRKVVRTIRLAGGHCRTRPCDDVTLAPDGGLRSPKLTCHENSASPFQDMPAVGTDESVPDATANTDNDAVARGPCIPSPRWRWRPSSSASTPSHHPSTVRRSPWRTSWWF